MVHTRRQGSDSDEEERDVQRGRTGGERRRVDPVLKEAHKRGLDVEKLHDSRTPAWRNLRGRSASQRKRSYYEAPEQEDEDDEVADQHSGSEGEEEQEESSGDEELEEEDEPLGQRRYGRRTRHTAQRYSPPKDDQPQMASRGGSKRDDRRQTEHTERRRHQRGYQQDREDSEEEEEEEEERARDPSQENELFALRYSVRQRRQVEFFDPVQYEGEMGSQQPADSGAPSRKRDRDERKPGQSDESEEERRERRREYSFRDRSLVTIKPASQQPASQGGGSGQQERKRPRHERRHDRGGSGRLHRTNSRGRFRDEADEVHGADDELPGTGAYGHGGHAGSGYGPPGAAAAAAAGAAPWELVKAAGAGLPLTHLGREKAGNAEITPLQVDPSVTFDTVGGLDHYIKALKEMIFLPLVYPELFERFHIAPPRGVLFYGPPGTGKTLVARALAAHASRAGKKVSFFMRKGADVLSKWVGEAERQLRLLFEEAQRHQPSIIFFDEIDGLAPVRSSKQDQIHNSIVSTLLALMDGLDARGQVVVIGATNRVDALDGALRRPGRFDRELVFPLPNLSARADILRIHTRKWADPPSGDLLQELASLAVGYCGADLKALCTEASLASLRRHYPQIYDADDKLLIDPGRVRVERRDFLAAFQTITPASHRSAVAHARPLPPLVAPVLLDHLQCVLAQLQASFPAAAACLRSGFGGGRNPAAGFGSLVDDVLDGAAGGSGSGSFSWAGGACLGVQRPRLLVCGPEGTGQAHLGPAILYALEGLPVHAIGLPSLLSDAGARAPEEALVHAVVEARRAAPAVLFLPHLQVWWDTAPNSLRATLWMLLADLPADLPLLLFATADVPASDLDPTVCQLFNVQSGGAYELGVPDAAQRGAFFTGISQALALPPPPEQAQAERPVPLPVLPRAPEAVAAEEEARKKAEDAAARQQYEEDAAALRALRMVLRDLTYKLLGNKKWEWFWEPEEDPEWWDKVTHPMDLATVLANVNARVYATPQQYLADIGRIVQCSREYWGADPAGVREISRACALEDEAASELSKAVPPGLQAKLEEIVGRGGPAPPPASMLVLPGVAPADGRTPGAHLMSRRPIGRPQSDDAVARRATRHAGGTDRIDDRLLHTDPEAAARHIRALRRQQQEQASQQQEQASQQQEQQQRQQEQQEQQPDVSPLPQPPAAVPAEEEMPSDVGTTTAAAAAVGMQERDVLAEATKENVPEAAPTVTPLADPAAAAAATAAKAAKGTLTAVVQQHGSSRLRWEGAAQQQPHQQRQAVAVEAEPAEHPQEVAANDAEQQHEVPEAPPAFQPAPEDYARADRLRATLVQQTEGLVLDNLESIHAKLSRLAVDQRRALDRDELVATALEAVHAWRAARQQA